MPFVFNAEPADRQAEAMRLLAESDARKLRKTEHVALMRDPAVHKAVWTAMCHEDRAAFAAMVSDVKENGDKVSLELLCNQVLMPGRSRVFSGVPEDMSALTKVVVLLMVCMRPLRHIVTLCVTF
jgi:hypothetical protein